MKTQKWLYGFLLINILLSACGTAYYVPSGKNVPLFREAGETRYAARAAAGFWHVGGDFQAAKAFDDKHAGLISLSTYSMNNQGGGSNIDVGYGKYKSLNKVVVFELYGGAGFGTLRNYHNSPNDTLTFPLPISVDNRSQSRVSHLGLWAQPQLGFTTRLFDLALIGGVRYMSLISVTEKGPLWPEQQQDLFNMRANKGNLLWEPGLVVRFGWDYVKAEMQYTFSYNLNNPSMNMEPLRISLGFSFLIPPKAKRQASAN
jgi:hypothetical protein